MLESQPGLGKLLAVRQVLPVHRRHNNDGPRQVRALLRFTFAGRVALSLNCPAEQ